jgi:hypothetical protein
MVFFRKEFPKRGGFSMIDPKDVMKVEDEDWEEEEED